jgi:hypothetical protein
MNRKLLCKKHVFDAPLKEHNHFEIENLLHAIEAINFIFSAHQKPVRLVPRSRLYVFNLTKLCYFGELSKEDFHLKKLYLSEYLLVFFFAE